MAAGTGGSVNVFASNNTDLVIDINGYYAPQPGITLAQGSEGARSLTFAKDRTTGKAWKSRFRLSHQLL